MRLHLSRSFVPHSARYDESVEEIHTCLDDPKKKNKKWKKRFAWEFLSTRAIIGRERCVSYSHSHRTSLLHLVALVLFKRFTFGLCGDRENEREAEDEDDDPLPMTAQNEPNTHACAWKLECDDECARALFCTNHTVLRFIRIDDKAWWI